MSIARPLAATLAGWALAATCACASAGHSFPQPVEPLPRTLVRAATAIAEAKVSGADSLAAEPLAGARRLLEEAANEEHLRHSDRASLLARESIAEAGYARAVAERVVADRRRAAATAQLADTADRTTAGTGAHP